MRCWRAVLSVRSTLHGGSGRLSLLETTAPAESLYLDLCVNTEEERKSERERARARESAREKLWRQWQVEKWRQRQQQQPCAPQSAKIGYNSSLGMYFKSKISVYASGLLGVCVSYVALGALLHGAMLCVMRVSLSSSPSLSLFSL